ncbi:MAG: MBG domain-containing protein, partial [Methylotenera sp.]
LAVNPAALVVTASNQTKTYGQTFSFTGTEFTSTGLQNAETIGSATLSSTGAAATAGVAGSPYAIVASNATDGTFNAANYSITYANGSLAVNPAALVVTASNQTKTYGQTFSFTGTEFTSSGLQNAETIGSATLSSAGAAATAGVAGSPYAIVASNATGGTFNAANYSITYANGSLAVNPAALVVTANAGQTKIYGNADPTLTYTSSGLLFGDTISGSQTRNPGENVGSYAINQGTLNAGSNYVLSYVSDNLSITPRNLTITASPGQNKIAGTADPLPFTFIMGGLGLVGGDTLSGALSRIAGETAGNYAIIQGSLDAGSNYVINYIGSNFAILAALASNNGGSGSGGGSGNPRNAAGLVDLNPMLGNYTNQQLFVLNVGATAAGNDSTGNQEACEGDPELLAKDKEFILLLNYGLKLPKGVNTSCDKTSI